MNTLNAAGLTLIESFETLRLTPYQDGRGIWTIGWGHTDGVTANTPPCTRAQADTWLQEDLASAERQVSRLIHAPLNDNQYSALVSLVFNAGQGPLLETMGRLLNQGNITRAADEFSRWNHSAGRVIDGLTRRRAAEKELFIKPV